MKFLIDRCTSHKSQSFLKRKGITFRECLNVTSILKIPLFRYVLQKKIVGLDIQFFGNINR
jgi:hypothetical protein